MSARFVLGALLIGLGGFAPDAIARARTFKDCSFCPTMVRLPPGKFLMGTAEDKGTAAKKTEIPAKPTEATAESTGPAGGNKLPQDTRENAETAAENPDLAAPEESSNDEGPQHTVTFKRSFAIGKYPVTRGEFAAFVRVTGYDPKECFQAPFDEDAPQVVLPRGLSWRNPGFPQTDRDPVVCVSYDDALRYVRWLSKKTRKPYRLPSEAEWEYAARGGTKTPRYWSGGDSRACRYANVRDAAAARVFRTGLREDEEEVPFFRCRDHHIYTAPVGSFRPNKFGLYDMLGNVWQWTADCYQGSYTGAPTDGSPVLTEQVYQDPESQDNRGNQGKQTKRGELDTQQDRQGYECQTRVLRGGSWANPPDQVRSAYRHGANLDGRTIYSGFRVARKR